MNGVKLNPPAVAVAGYHYVFGSVQMLCPGASG